jgi:hypothetical protein
MDNTNAKLGRSASRESSRCSRYLSNRCNMLKERFVALTVTRGKTSRKLETTDKKNEIYVSRLPGEQACFSPHFHLWPLPNALHAATRKLPFLFMLGDTTALRTQYAALCNGLDDNFASVDPTDVLQSHPKKSSNIQFCVEASSRR